MTQILKEFSKHQDIQKRQAQQRQQAQRDSQFPPQTQPQAQVTPQPQFQSQAQPQSQSQPPLPPALASSISMLDLYVNLAILIFLDNGPIAQISSSLQQNQSQNLTPSPANSVYSTRPPSPANSSSSFTPHQYNNLKTQVLAFKSLYKSRTIPQTVQSQLFFTQPVPSSSPHSPITLQQQQQQTQLRPQVFSHVSRALSMTPEPSTSNPQSASKYSKVSPLTDASPSPAPSRTDPATPVQLSAPPPTTTLGKLGVTGYVNPFSLLPADMDVSSKPSSFIPSLMPPPLNVTKMKEERENQIADKIFERIVQLSNELPSELDSASELADDNDIDKLIELKSLQLTNRQKAIRGDIVADIYYFNTVAMNEGNQIHFTRMKQTTLVESEITEQFDSQQRIERAKRENQKKRDHLRNVCSHSRDIHSNLIVKHDRRTKFGKGIMSIHFYTEKEEQKRIERTAKQRLQALKANDEEAYIKLLDQTKDTRITHLLRQTNSFLGSLAQAVKDQQKQTKSIKASSAYITPVEEIDEDDGAGDDNEDKEKVDYYAVAHRVKEVITKQPSILVGGTLKEYQLKGLQWMISLVNNNLNGILADEMGLGKTIQSISLITYLVESKRIPGPYLVIVPLSTLTNWTLEFERWAPSLKTIIYKGPPVARKALQNLVRAGDFQVVLTTYEYIIRDKAVLSKIKWVHMIIDEGHRMKNSQSKLSATLTQFYVTKYRLILTGTPLQNNLPELWALLNFVLPKIFNSVKSFDEWFNTPFANTGGQDKMDLSEEETLLVIRRLHKVLRPFLLRRLKKDVEKDLPDKVEKVIKCKMSALQSSIYQQVLKYKKMVGGSGAKGLNNKLMQLRKVCNHPFVFQEVENLINPAQSSNDLLWRTAGKFELLDRVLPKFQATGHRILVFFQMTQIMDIMEDFLRLRGIQYLRLDGGTKADERTDLLLKFNAPNSPYFAFLLSTRAGGLGLNLQTADTVIIYDTDWNPHQDLQAQDRAHRIGQTKEVRILRLITENSVEETILARAHQKLDIDGKVIQAGKFDNKSTSEEQEAFLRSLLEQEEQKRTGKNEEDEELDDDELNDILARDDSERVLFAEIDRQRNLESDYGKGRQFERLFSEKELPEVYQEQFLQEAVNPEPVVENYGRGARERKVLHYDDGLTEEQWLDAIDDDDDTPENAIARKRARIQKRKENKDKREGLRDSQSPSAYADYVTPSPGMSPANGNASSSSGVKRKRGRRPKSEVEAALAATNAASAAAISDTVLPPIPPRKKGKGRPPKIKETLNPQARADLTETMRIIYDHVTNLEEEGTGRRRIDIFLTLPSKRLYPDYYVLIKNPIACDVIQKRINNHTYQMLGEFRADFKLMFDNARVYNEEGSVVVEDANELQQAFNDKLNELVPGAALRALTESSGTPGHSGTSVSGYDTNAIDPNISSAQNASAGSVESAETEAPEQQRVALKSGETSNKVDSTMNSDDDYDDSNEQILVPKKAKNSHDWGSTKNVNDDEEYGNSGNDYDEDDEDDL